MAIVRGTGKGQIRRITTRDSATALTVPAWTTTPDTTSVYVIGAIEYSYKTGRFFLVPLVQDQKQAFNLSFTPTTNDAECYLRRFMNHSTTAENFAERDDDMHNVGRKWAASDPDCTFDLKSARTTLDTQKGLHRWEWGGVTGGNPKSSYERQNVWLQAELAGFQGADAVVFHELEIEGVME